MYYSVRVPDVEIAWLVNMYVESGQSVIPGASVVDIYVPGGIVETLTCEFHGIVAEVEEENRAYYAGDQLCHVISREDRNSRTKGFIPKPSTYMRYLRTGHVPQG